METEQADPAAQYANWKAPDSSQASGTIETRTAEENRLIKELASWIANLPIQIDDKANFILTKAGLKPASELDIVISTQSDEGVTRHMSDEQLQEILTAIEQSGLPHLIRDREYTQEMTWTEDGREKPYSREHITVLIGRTQEELDRLVTALQSGSPELIGRAFGFPAGAIAAFNEKRSKLDLQTLPKEIRLSDAILFSSPTLSADGWQEEIKQGQQYANFLKTVSPQIYQEFKETMLKGLHSES